MYALTNGLPIRELSRGAASGAKQTWLRVITSVRWAALAGQVRTIEMQLWRYEAFGPRGADSENEDKIHERGRCRFAG
jgi:hypothetical protein